MVSIDEFMDLSASRLPSVDEFVGLAEGLGIKIVQKDGKPFLRHPPTEREFALRIASILRREPWRTQAITRHALKETPPPAPIEEPQVEEQPASKKKIAVPPHATLVMIDRTAHACGWEQCHLWCWVGADRWYYASESEPDGSTGHSFSDAHRGGPREQASGGSAGGIA